MHFPAWQIATVTDVTNNANADTNLFVCLFVSVTAYAERF
jgi:hypothetical protein